MLRKALKKIATKTMRKVKKRRFQLKLDPELIHKTKPKKERLKNLQKKTVMKKKNQVRKPHQENLPMFLQRIRKQLRKRKTMKTKRKKEVKKAEKKFLLVIFLIKPLRIPSDPNFRSTVISLTSKCL